MNNSITPHTPTVAGDQLVAERERLGLRYLSRGPLPEPNAPLAPEARLRPRGEPGGAPAGCACSANSCGGRTTLRLR